MGGFDDLVDEMDDMIMASVSDSSASYLSRDGQVLVEELPVIVELEVEREDRGGMITLVRAHCVQKRLLEPYDRKGAFRMADGVWQIDGIHSDDGSLITFYVVP